MKDLIWLLCGLVFDAIGGWTGIVAVTLGTVFSSAFFAWLFKWRYDRRVARECGDYAPLVERIGYHPAYEAGDAPWRKARRHEPAAVLNVHPQADAVVASCWREDSGERDAV